MLKLTLQMSVRIAGTLALITGLIFWVLDDEVFPVLHIGLGAIVTIALIILAFRAKQKGVSTWLIILSMIWALGLPVWGLAQMDYATPARVLHIIYGLLAIVLAEILGARMSSKTSNSSI
jgi:hypothetical protein